MSKTRVRILMRVTCVSLGQTRELLKSNRIKLDLGRKTSNQQFKEWKHYFKKKDWSTLPRGRKRLLELCAVIQRGTMAVHRKRWISGPVFATSYEKSTQENSLWCLRRQHCACPGGHVTHRKGEKYFFCLSIGRLIFLRNLHKSYVHVF